MECETDVGTIITLGEVETEQTYTRDIIEINEKKRLCYEMLHI